MTDDEFNLMMELRSIPQRNSHFHVLHGADIAVAAVLELRGLVVESTRAGHDRAFRLNKPGREMLLDEWVARGKPKRNKQGEWSAP